MDLSESLVKEIRLKLIENAEELINESCLLLENKHYARAYCLAHLASEEIAKIMMLISYYIEYLKGKNDWKSFDKTFKNHKSKIKNIAYFDYFFTKSDKTNEDISILKEDIKSIEKYNNFKNYSLYTSEIPEIKKFLKPSEIINRNLAKAMNQLAINRLNAAKNAEICFNKINIEKIIRNPKYKIIEKEFLEDSN